MPDQSKYSQFEDNDQKINAEHSIFEALFYASISPMVIFKGPEFILEMFNKPYQQIYGEERKLIGNPLLQAVPELRNSTFPDILKSVYETGIPYISQEGLSPITNPETGKIEERYFDTTFTRITYAGDPVYRILGAPREVSQRVKAQKKIESSLIELKFERELRERFVSSLSHDLRTPLSVAKISSQLIRQKFNDPDAVKRIATRITDSIERADRMIRDLLDANSIRAGRGIPVSLGECNLIEIVKGVARDINEIHGISPKIISLNEKINGKWDRVAIHRVVENLVTNAIKYGFPDSEITITLTTENNSTIIAVHNHGNPIPMEDHNSIFTHYSRSKAAESTGKMGWGIGLALVKGIVEAHNGSVQVQSNEINGTTFKVILPLDPNLS